MPDMTTIKIGTNLEESAAEHDKLQRSGVNSHRPPSRRSSAALAAARFANIFIETFKIKFAEGQWLLGPTWHYELMLVMIPSAVLLSKGFKTRSRCTRNCSSSDPWSKPFSCLHLRPSLQSCRREAASFHHRDFLRNEKLFSAVLLASGRLLEHLPVEG